MKKMIRDVAALNLCGTTAESLAEITAIENVALVLLTPRVRPLMQHIAMRDVAMVKEVPDGVRLLMHNGDLRFTADQLVRPCFLLVNGRLRLDESMTPELIASMVVGGMINGELIAGEKQLDCALLLHKLQSQCGVQVNGRNTVMPEGFRLRESGAPISVQEAAGMTGGWMCLGKLILESGAAKMLRQRDARLAGTAGAVVPQEDAEDFYALWQGQGEIILLEANTRYVAEDLMLRGADAALRLRGDRYVAGDLTLMDTVTPAHLAGMGRLWVTGTLMLPEALLDTVLPHLENEPELVPYQGKLLVDEEKMELGEAELSAYTQGVTLLVQGQLDLREDLAPEVLRDKVRLLYNCGQVILNAEQQAALLPVTINQGHLSLRKAEAEQTQPQANADECILGDMAYLEL